jgi:hypothetical protein
MYGSHGACVSPQNEKGHKMRRAMARKKSPKAVTKPKAKKEFRQLIVTLSASNGEIEKIEELGSAGKRHAFSEAEFATLAGDSSLRDVWPALEAAYMAGIQDGFDDAQCDDPLAGASHEQGGASESSGEDVLRAGIRQIIFRRALRRRLERAGEQAPRNGAHDARS